MAIKRFLQFTTKSSRDSSVDHGSGETDDVSVIDRPLRFGQRAWATYRTTFAAITGSPLVNAPDDHSAPAALTRNEQIHETDARHLDIGGYFQTDHAWAGSMHETAPLENIFDHGDERLFNRFGPH